MDDVAELLAKYPKRAARFDPAEAFRQLSNPDPAVRLLGARWVAKHAHGEVNNFTEYWLKAPATVERLLPLLDDPDPAVVEELVGAAGVMADPRYGNKDRRVIPRAIQLLESDRPNTRVRAAVLLTNFDDESLANPLLALFADPDKRVRSVVIRELPVGKWSAATKERVRLAALERLRDRAMEVRCAAAYLLISAGKREDVETLRNLLKDVKGHNARTAYGDYLDLLAKRFRVKK
jgi:HEAT repeat protein